jgi:hypothetical protein
MVAVVAPVKLLKPVAIDPFTSSVEKGVVVPIPIWAFDAKPTAINAIKMI